jgi:hypothetical protein
LVTVWDKKASPVSHTPWNIRDRECCARWIPCSLIIKYKADRIAISSELFARFEAEGEAFLSRVVMADETWFHHTELETKRSRTRNGTDKAYTHLFLVGARL